MLFHKLKAAFLEGLEVSVALGTMLSCMTLFILSVALIVSLFV